VSLAKGTLEEIRAGWGYIPTVLLLLSAYEELREDLLRCGALAVSDRVDGRLSKTQADQIRQIAHRACWPEDTA
jgi:hypothetical protein